MTVVLTLVAVLMLVPIALIDLVFLTETLFGIASRRAAPPVPSAARVALVLPAHNEAQTLGKSGPLLMALASPTRRLVLVADNCSDDTAAIARAQGFEVIERHDATLRGKGYALAFGRDHLALDPPDVAIVLDADCVTDAASIDRLAARVIAGGRAVQAAYMFHPAPDAPPKVQISNFAFAVKNRVRQRGLSRIGAAAVLTGSGMAFPWPLFAGLDLATGNVVEDLALGIDLIEQGAAPVFEDAATVWSDCSSDEGTRTQRSRWEGGFIGTMRQFAGRLIASGIARADRRRIWMGLHLMVPPLSLLLAVNVVATVVAGGLALLGADAWPALALGGLLAAMGVAVLLAWAVEGRHHIRASVLLRAPLYLVWKLALYLRIASGRQRVAWTRTERIDQ